MTFLSRRQMIYMSGSLLLCENHKLYGESARVETVPWRTYPDALARAFSPDGARLCVERLKASRRSISVEEIASGDLVSDADFFFEPLSVGFLGDGQSLFLEFAGGKHSILDIATGAKTDGTRTIDPTRYYDQIEPAEARNLLIAHYRFKPNRLEWLARVESGTYRELRRVDIPILHPNSTLTSDLSISADRSTLAYFSDGALVCRGIPDLDVRWNKLIEGGLRAAPISLSAGGDYLAVTLSRYRPVDAFGTYVPLSIEIYEGRTGKQIARLPPSTEFNDNIAIAPNGKLMAVVTNEPGPKGSVLPTAHIYEVSSGQRVASLVHDRIERGRHQFVKAGASVDFAANGKVIVTSGRITKMWRVLES